MSLITPDFGLIFWMVIIFGLVFLLLAKFGFPVITSMVRKRSDHIEESLRKAEEAQRSLESLAEKHRQMIEAAKLEQSKILKETSELRDNILSAAQAQAQNEANKMIAEAKAAIAAERDNSLNEIKRQVSVLSMQVAEKIIRKELDKSPEQMALIDRLVDEISQMDVKS